MNTRPVSQCPVAATLPPPPRGGDTVELRLATVCLSFPRWHSKGIVTHAGTFRWHLDVSAGFGAGMMTGLGCSSQCPPLPGFALQQDTRSPRAEVGAWTGAMEAAAVLPPRQNWELPPWRNIPFSNSRPCRGLSRGGGWGSSHAVSKALCCLKCSLRHLMTHSNSWKE